MDKRQMEGRVVNFSIGFDVREFDRSLLRRAVIVKVRECKESAMTCRELCNGSPS